MADDDLKKNYPSLPSNYVSLAQLRERWLNRKQKPNDEESAGEKQEQKPRKYQDVASQSRHPQHKPSRQQEYYDKNRNFEEKSKFDKSQKFDRHGCHQIAPFTQKQKGKARVAEVGEDRADFVLDCSLNIGNCEGNDVRPLENGGGGRGVGAERVLSVCMVEVVEDDIMATGSRGDGFKKYGGDRREDCEVKNKDSKGEDAVRMKGVKGEKKADDGALGVGSSVEGFRVEQQRKAMDQRAKFGVVENVGEGVDETGGENARDPDSRVVKEEESVEQRGRKGGKKKWGSKGIINKEFRKGSKNLLLDNRGEGNGIGVAKEDGIQMDVNEEIGEQNGPQRNGENERDNKDKAQKGLELEERNEKKVSMAIRNKNECLEEKIKTGRYQKWHKKGIVGVKVIRDKVREKTRDNEVVEQKYSVVGGEINLKSDKCNDGLLRNGYNHVSTEPVVENFIDEKVFDKDKEQLGGENEAKVKGLLMTSETKNEEVRFGGRHRRKGGKKGVSRAKYSRNSEKFSLNNGRVRNGREKGGMDSWNRSFQETRRHDDKQRNGGLIWVKKGDVSDANTA